MIESIKTHFTVSREHHNQRVDVVTAQLLSQYSRSQIGSWIKSGSVTVNKEHCKPKDKVLQGDLIEISIELEHEVNNLQAEEIPLHIIYEDSEVLVVNKPAGLVVHPGAGNPKHTLVNALLHHDPSLHNLPRAGIIHRLDKDTTGLLIVAKSLTAHTALIRQMQAREIQRHYFALVQGPILGSGTIDTGFGRHPIHRLKMSVLDHGRQAITHYSVKKHYKDYTLLDIQLMTGRTHQIRVHLAHIRHPIIGDPLYGGRMKFPPHASDELRQAIEHFKRQALHAYSISFFHPKTHETIALQAPLPDDFQFLLNRMEQS